MIGRIIRIARRAQKLTLSGRDKAKFGGVGFADNHQPGLFGPHHAAIVKISDIMFKQFRAIGQWRPLQLRNILNQIGHALKRPVGQFALRRGATLVIKLVHDRV